MKRLGVLGTFVWDRIWHPGSGASEPLEQWGGIAYSLAALAAACPAGWEIVPIARLGRDLSDLAFDFLHSLPHVHPTPALQVVDEPNNRVELRYHDAAERSERLDGGVSSWSLDELLPVVDGVDALYVNFVSGLEMNLSTAQELTSRLDIPTYADLHSLFLGPPSRAPREPRRLPLWAAWFRCFDAVQLNAGEAELTGVKNPTPDRLFRSVESPRPSVVLVTHGGGGAAFAGWGGGPWVAGSQALPVSAAGELHVGHVPLATGASTGDPTGCGDVWGSVVFAGLLDRRELAEAIARGHQAASAKIQTRRIDDLAAAVAAAI